MNENSVVRSKPNDESTSKQMLTMYDRTMYDLLTKMYQHHIGLTSEESI